MLDTSSRQALMERIKQSTKKASSNVSTKVEAVKGPFRITISEADNVIGHFYKDHPIGSIKVASLDDDVVELINSDARGVAQDMVETLASSFDINEFETKLASIKKESANAVVDENTAQMITQKQLTDKKPSLHPRQNEFHNTVTQKQLPENGLRPGTYNVVTQGQLRDERSTFYNEPRTAGDWKDEDRHIVTEGQFNEGTSKYTDVGKSDRDEMGAEFDGGPEKQSHMTGEKQLIELLSHHEWTEPHTVTEGKEQLGKQDGELARIAASEASKLIKEAMEVLGKTIIAAGVTPDNLSNVLKRLVSHPSKYLVLADTINKYKPTSITNIDDKISKAQYFGKVANVTGKNWSNSLVADIMVRQLSKLAFHPKYVVDALVAMSDDTQLIKNIDKAANSVLENKTKTANKNDNVDVFKNVLSGKKENITAASNNNIVANTDVDIEGSADDGFYQYAGTIEEVGVSTDDRDTFSKAASEYAKKIVTAQIGSNVQLIPVNLEVNEEKQSFKVNFKDPIIADKNLQARSEKRHKIASTSTMTKTAQMGGGGMPPAGGGGMANPAPPPGGGDMGAGPAGESFSQEPPPPPGEDLGGEGDMGGGGGEPKPLGSVCGICGSTDVDLDNGEQNCNNCGAHGTIHARMEYDKAPGVIQESEQTEEPGFGIGTEDEDGLGAPNEPMMDETGGTGTTMPNLPVAASIKITPRLLEKLAEQKIELGSVCPNCGSNNTDKVKSARYKGDEGICWDCWQEYNFQVKANTKKKHNVFAQIIWTPKFGMTKQAGCSSCTRLHKDFVKSLSNYGMTWKEFDKLALVDRADTILKMANTGTLNINSNISLPKSIQKSAASFKQKFDKFPSASCREKIARRFGENATAMSGPCQGKRLHDCVCGQLEGLGIYTDGLAAKVAHVVSSKDPMEHSPSETCVKMFVKDYDYDVKKACTICDGLRAATASSEDLLIEAIIQTDSSLAKKAQALMNQAMPPMGVKPMPKKPMLHSKPMMGAPKPMAAPMPKPMPAPPMAGGPKPMMGDPSGNMIAPGGSGMEATMDSPVPSMGAPKPMSAPMAGGAGPASPMPKPMGGASPMAAPGGSQGMPSAPGAKPLPDMANPLSSPINDEPIGDDGGPGGGIGGMDDGSGLMGGDDDGGASIGLEIDNFDDDGISFGDEQGGLPGGNPADGGLGGGPEGLGGGGDLKTILVQGLQSIIDALSGNISDEMIDTTGDEFGDDSELGGDIGDGLGGDESLDTEGITDDVVDDGASDGGGGFGGGDEESEGHDHDSGIPGLSDEGGDDELSKSSNPSVGDDDDKDMSVPHDKSSNHNSGKKEMKSPSSQHGDQHAHKEHNAKPMIAPDRQSQNQGDDSSCGCTAADDNTSMTKEAQKIELENGLIRMKHGTISTKENSLNSLYTALMKQAAKDKEDVKKLEYKSGKESKLTEKATQDASDFGKYKDGGKIGHEEPFTTNVTKKPDVPRASATLGAETSDVTLNDKDRPSIPQNAPKMEGEEHYKPEKQTQQEGNQGGQTATATSKQNNKTASACKCGSQSECGTCKSCKECCGCKTSKVTKPDNKTAQKAVTPKRVDNLEDDPDLNNSSGPGKGKTHIDKVHSQAVDEKKPSEGVNEPDVPEAPNGGRLTHEHTVEKADGTPNIPANGGMNPQYDQNEKNKPEKIDQMLGNAAINTTANEKDRAIKIAGLMIKNKMITPDELPNKIAELSRLTPQLLNDFENLMQKEASSKKGLQKEAQSLSAITAWQTPIDQQHPDTVVKNPKDKNSDMINKMSSLFTLDKRNKDFEKIAGIQ